jgi:hypothetical protein
MKSRCIKGRERNVKSLKNCRRIFFCWEVREFAKILIKFSGFWGKFNFCRFQLSNFDQLHFGVKL